MDDLIDLVPLNYTDAVVVVGAALLGIAAGALGVFAVLRQRSSSATPSRTRRRRAWRSRSS